MNRSPIVIVLLTLGVAGARAQAPVRLTLDEAIAQGLLISPRVEEIDARQDAARAVEEQRKAASTPQIGVQAGYARTNHVNEFGIPGGVVLFPDIPDRYRSRIDLQWPIYTGGRTSAQERAAGAETSAIAQDRDAARADLKLDITRAYWAVITARAAVDVVSQALARTTAHLNDVRNMLTAGLVPPNEVLSLEAQQARQQILLIEAQNLAETAAADFRRLAGLAPETPFELADRIEAPPAVTQQVSALVEAARTGRAERKALEIRLGALGDRKAAADAGRLPLIAAVGGYDLASPNPKVFPLRAGWRPSWDIGVNLTWSLFDGGRAHAETAEVAANQRAAAARLKDFDATVDVEVRQRAADLASAEAAIGAADVGVRSAAEARRVVADRFSAGVATNTDVIDAQVALLQAELDRTRALAAAHMATARLNRAVGR